ncbi:hypothetical protein A4R44_02040 [Amycolatopsis sp. M39]|uniref:Uncharacterized protein n=1 Tax=Amycolatopsis rubida TaxID=112413 RepID=A0A1I5EU89_9PSEU|nr:hypothetical protein A4R44_02040 [Amycolatopsis sp. M39]SFO15064.1 hypothetical protein SAMN05421854_101809 [Amycolatopsis rubida]
MVVVPHEPAAGWEDSPCCSTRCGSARPEITPGGSVTHLGYSVLGTNFRSFSSVSVFAGV